jgi:hypothetical protein
MFYGKHATGYSSQWYSLKVVIDRNLFLTETESHSIPIPIPKPKLFLFKLPLASPATKDLECEALIKFYQRYLLKIFLHLLSTKKSSLALALALKNIFFRYKIAFIELMI